MKDILKGIGKFISIDFNVEHKPVDEDLENKINQALAVEREKIRPSREDIDNFSWITGDTNPIHRLTKRAKMMGFEDIPLMGAHVAAYGEQFINGVVKHMENFWGTNIKIIGQDNKFRAPLYPGEKTFWQVKGFKKTKRGIELSIGGTARGIEVISINTVLGTENPLLPQIAGPIYTRRYLLNEAHIEEFYNCVGGKLESPVPNMLPAAFVPATLLRLLEDKTQTMEGTNMSMNYRFIEKLHQGRLQVDIFPPRRPTERKGNFIYKFRTVVSQNTKPITYGEILSGSPVRIEFN